MAWTQSDLDAIDLALKSNALRVEFQGRSVTYRSVQEIIEIRGIAVAEINAGSVMRRQYRVYTNKGWSG